MTDAWEIEAGWPEGLPRSVIDAVELPPATRLVIRVLRDYFGNDLYITPRIPLNSLNQQLVPPRDPMVLVRKAFPNGFSRTDGRFIGEATIEVHAFTSEPDGELKGYLISDACRTVLRDAAERSPRYPGLGTLNRVRLLTEPTRKTDWANATGPVQYADLPAGVWRTETQYRVIHRRDTEGGA